MTAFHENKRLQIVVSFLLVFFLLVLGSMNYSLFLNLRRIMDFFISTLPLSDWSEFCLRKIFFFYDFPQLQLSILIALFRYSFSCWIEVSFVLLYKRRVLGFLGFVFDYLKLEEVGEFIRLHLVFSLYVRAIAVNLLLCTSVIFQFIVALKLFGFQENPLIMECATKQIPVVIAFLQGNLYSQVISVISSYAYVVVLFLQKNLTFSRIGSFSIALRPYAIVMTIRRFFVFLWRKFIKEFVIFLWRKLKSVFRGPTAHAGTMNNDPFSLINNILDNVNRARNNAAEAARDLPPEKYWELSASSSRR